MVEEKAEGDGVAVTLLDFSLEWLAAWVLSFGTMADILAPERLKQLLAAEAEKVAAKYAPARPLTSLLSATAGNNVTGKPVRRAVSLSKVS